MPDRAGIHTTRRAALRRWRASPVRRLLAWSACALLLLCVWQPVWGQSDSPPGPPGTTAGMSSSATRATRPPGAASQQGPDGLLQRWTGREGLRSTLQLVLLLSVVSLAPAILLMTTSFVRIVVVLGLLRQALGVQGLPPAQVISSIALFLTLLIMAPVWSQVYHDAVVPYSEGEIDLEQAWQRGQEPVRRFMSKQIDRTGNAEDVLLFLDYLEPSPEDEQAPPRPTYVYYGARTDAGERDVPMQALLPGFMLSELKTAFLIGFQIYVPFLILDLVVASVTVSIGMPMLPPALVSLPFKLLLFVLVDGWHLVVQMLLESFEPYL